MKGKRYKVASSYVIFLLFFQNIITLNPFKINTFSLIPYALTLSVPFPSKKQTPQQMKISPASATGFWNELYFYRAKFIIMESTLFELYNRSRILKNQLLHCHTLGQVARFVYIQPLVGCNVVSKQLKHDY